MGAVGRALPDRRGSDQPAKPSATASPGWTPAPASGYPSSRPFATVDRRRAAAARLLAAARTPRPGIASPPPGRRSPACTTGRGQVWVERPGGGQRRDLDHEEDHAFWAWAAVKSCG